MYCFELFNSILNREMKLSLVLVYGMVLVCSSMARPKITGDMIKTMAKTMIARLKKVKAEVRECFYMDISIWSDTGGFMVRVLEM